MRRVKLLLVGLILVGVLGRQAAFVVPARAQGIAQSLYAYVYKVPGGPVVISAVDPGNPDQSHWLYTIPLPGNAGLIDALASPDGRWIALIPASSGEWLRLIEVATGQIRDVRYAGITFDFSTGSFWGEFQPVAWSPNSQWLAFASGTTDAVTDVFVYSLADDTRTNLSNDPAFQYAVAWSPDSIYLASGGIGCNGPECDVQIDVFDWPSRSHIISQNPIWTDPNFLDKTVCQLRWSPDAHYLSFVASCDGRTPENEKETFMLDRIQGTVRPLTHYTQTAYQDPNAPVYYPLRVGRYDASWYAADSFFLGALYGEDVASQYLFRSRIARYDVLTDTQTLLRADVMAEGWTLNPAQTQVAFRTVTGYPVRTYLGVEVANITAGALTTIGTGPAGCDLAWSPDGMILGYAGRVHQSWSSGLATLEPMESCHDGVNAFYFIDSTTGQLTQYTLSPVELAESVRAAGWIVFDMADLPPTLVPFMPVSDPGPDRTITDTDNSGSELVTLDGSASSDPNGTIIDYLWVENGAIIASGATPTLDLAVGVHTIYLTVTDNDGEEVSAMVTITIEAAP